MSDGLKRSNFISVECQANEAIWIIRIMRPEARNSLDGPTARELAHSLIEFDKHKQSRICIVTGEGGCFCAGADLKAVSMLKSAEEHIQLTSVNELEINSDGSVYDTSGPMGFSRLQLSKPVIAAVEGYAVAGGLELACWCDLRVASEDAVFGVFCRRWGVPLIDGGTFRLPRIVGFSRAMDMILTGRPVNAQEAYSWGLVNRLSRSGQALSSAVALANELIAFPQHTLRSDRMSAYQCEKMEIRKALATEFEWGKRADDYQTGAKLFAEMKIGRGGSFEAFRPLNSPVSADSVPLLQARL